ncbi:Metallo-hydrolase/oxidoreductase [Mytilinidion resinicola]|uniref:Metallo-hydrolase/oxidoreductase n=1 Tax=Mytilinidion resinicola TaxID=574789 RepID=A0A6A6YR10_9PEZI|nr:Metallo-hydrolase/oxidoreductase [Mytilinidion resinicola]KAF2810395.1 Metallo-hydrolase/oxidoreductase [Mytilinidion resinicola]
MKHLYVDPRKEEAPTRERKAHLTCLPKAKETKLHPTRPGGETASLFFVGTATTILEWEGMRVMTDPNFLHAGDHVSLGPGISAERITNPAVDLQDLPRIDAVLLSHYHGDHFDQKVEESLRRDIPIITTLHAKSCLQSKGQESFSEVHDLESFQSLMLDIETGSIRAGKKPGIKVTGMPGKHVKPGLLSTANNLLKAVPPSNGWMIELGYRSASDSESFENSYRIYISGDTLMVDELKEIHERYKDQSIDLMLIHLGGTTLPSPAVPLLMVTMDAKQGVELVQLIKPDVTIPIHYDDYNVFASPLSDFKTAVDEAELSSKVVYLDRKDEYKFKV